MAAGQRSLLAFWIGGAASPAAQAGVRGMLAPWIGGASAGASAPPPPAPAPSAGGAYRVELPPRLQDAIRRRILDEDELLLLLAVSVDGRSLLH